MSQPDFRTVTNSSRRTALKQLGGASIATILGTIPRTLHAYAMSSDRLSFEIERHTPTRFHEDGASWCHARAGRLPASDGMPPAVVLTMNTTGGRDSDVFTGVISTRTDDLGKTWETPKLDRNLAPRLEQIGDQPLTPVAASDFFPMFHAASGRLLNIGHTVTYDRGDRDRWLFHHYRERHTVYATYDAVLKRWNPWQRLLLPESAPGEYFYHAGAGSVQRCDLPSGEVLLPLYRMPAKRDGNKISRSERGYTGSIVVRCAFDGERLTYLERGNELRVESHRGVGEPSLTRFGDRYFLTLRNEANGYVATGSDGLGFDPPKPWTFDDGRELGSYNTQQHWVTHRDGLFLVYTRKGANNDEIFRHRAPLFVAQVDPDRLVVIKETETVAVPKRGARLGNFGTTNVTPHESWITVAETMRSVPKGSEADGSLWVAKMLWDRPNRASES